MPNYKLGFVDKKEIKIIDLIDIKDLSKLDEFTCQFKSEEQLKLYLIKKNIDYKDYLKKSIKVVYRYNNTDKKIPVFYSDIRKYLDEYYLRGRLMVLKDDIEFLEKIARHYSLGSDKFNPQGVNVNAIRNYINDVRCNGGFLFESRALNEAIDDLFMRAIFRPADKESGEVKSNYRGLRDLALFIYKYERQQQEVRENDNQIYMDDILNRNETQVEDWEQITFDDWENDGDEYDDYVEPIFAPNTEEEREYQEYLDSLPDEIRNPEDHPHYGR